MKAVLEFNLNDPDDQLEHMRCVKSSKMAIALWDVDQYIRGLIKQDKEYVSIEDLRESFNSFCWDNEVNLEELNM